MTIDFINMQRHESKQALGYFIDCIEDNDEKNIIRSVFDNEGIDTADELTLLEDANIPTMCWKEEVTLPDKSKSFESTIVNTKQISLIQKLRNFSHHLLTDSSITELVNIKPESYKQFLIESIKKRNMGPTIIATAPAAAPAPAPPPSTTPDTPDLTKQIDAINKLTVKVIPRWNGNTSEYPRTIRTTKQVLKNYGMVDIYTANTTVPSNDGSLKWQLWLRQNNFVSAALISQFTGGQAAIIIRQHSEKDSAGYLIFCDLYKHYESASNKTTMIVHINGKLTNLQYTPRTNYSLQVHLTKFQTLLQDLADCGHPSNPTNEKSLLCNSIKHSSFTNMIDGYLNNSQVDTAQMITELTQKAERLGQSNPSSRRNVNFQKSQGKQKHGKGVKKDKWFIPKEKWNAMSAQERKAHLEKKRAAQKQSKYEKEKTPVPSSNYNSQLNQLQTTLQLLSMTDAQRAQLQQVTQQMSQLHTLQQPLPPLHHLRTMLQPQPLLLILLQP